MVTTTRLAEPSSFSNSLASILYKGGPEPELPGAGLVTLAQEREPERLAELFAARDIAAFTDACIRPRKGLPSQREMLAGLDRLQETIGQLGEEHPDLAEDANATNAVLLVQMKNQATLKMNLDALLAG